MDRPPEWETPLAATVIAPELEAALPTVSVFSEARHDLSLQPGRIITLVGSPGSGMTRVGLSLLAEHTTSGPIVAVDVRGWLCPAAAWEVGISSDRLVVVRCADRLVWPKVVGALVEGVRSLYVEVPGGIHDQVLRRLAALARRHRTGVVLRPLKGSIAPGISHLRLEAQTGEWDGADRGHGRLRSRRLSLQVRGKGIAESLIEAEDHGTDVVRLVRGLGASAAGRAG